jgi:hypothetical protein
MHNQTLALDFRELQGCQHRHDELAHRDVLALSPQRRVTHFTLHFAKYAGALLVARRSGNRLSMARIITDSLIIALASANSLGIELQQVLGDDSEHADSWRDETGEIVTVLLRYTEVVGEMAKACEAFDHASERYPSFDVLERAVTKLTRLTLLCAASEGVDIAASVAERWESVEAKVITATEGASKIRPTSVSAAA